ncbi:MAG: bifunctional glycosyltransferase family 2/GtrA family protein [Clostridia bacterium]|nr:bifunctional glycosyltransferase family 2/GtrA family protein [Clostridia bacterium]MBQ4298128.1 bifunctional glycosyltransferase family 2/GtrA family protein [Clostridia bacterium]
MEFDIARITVVIPSYQPDEKLKKTFSGLAEAGFTDILVVDDGGGERFAPVFDELKRDPRCTLLVHEINRGKGAALKTAFSYLRDHRPDSLGCVTADGDGQHLPEDVLACAKRMCETDACVLGVRDFSLPEVPKRSRAGNRITSLVFRLFCGMKISDTQTGLRAFPRRYYSELLTVSGDRYEYETNMLLSAKRMEMPIKEEPISTVYIDENRASHFHPFRDSVRIYSFILKYCLSSVASALVDLIAFYLLFYFFGAQLGRTAVLVCTFGARVVSAFVNFLINRGVVFRGGAERRFGITLARYFLLAVCLILCSTGLVSLLKILFGTEHPLLLTFFKMIVDTVLFLCSFRIQKNWVFRD